MARGRKPIEIDKNEFQRVINELEQAAGGQFANRSRLWEAIEASEWGKSRTPRPLMAAVALAYFSKLNLSCATPVGKKGREKGSGPVAAGPRKSRAIPLTTLTALKRVVPAGYEKTVERAASGSLKAAVKLKCLDCCNYQRKEIALCPITECSLHNFRPYKKADNLEDDNESGSDSD